MSTFVILSTCCFVGVVKKKQKNRTISTSIIFSTSCFVGGGVASLKKLNRTYVNFDHARTVSVGEMEGNVNMTQHDIFRIQNAWFFVGQGGWKLKHGSTCQLCAYSQGSVLQGRVRYQSKIYSTPHVNLVLTFKVLFCRERVVISKNVLRCQPCSFLSSLFCPVGVNLKNDSTSKFCSYS